MKKEIVQDGNKVLRAIAQEVPEELFGSKELFSMLEDMKETLDTKDQGVALAAPQIALPYRIFIVRYDRMTAEEMEPSVGIYINPTIIKRAKKKEQMDEGCLSVDGVFGKTIRHTQATVRAQDENGHWFTRGAGGMLAQAFQHEIDHLNGILFIDHATDLHTIETEAS